MPVRSTEAFAQRPHATSESNSRYTRLERCGVVVAFCLYLIFQINAAFHHGSWGQDFDSHRAWISSAVANPWQYATVLDAGRTNPPLYELLCAAVYKITNGIHYLEVIALMSIVLNTLGLLLLYQLIRRSIRDPLLRLSCLIFIMFLPFAMITELVLATDALAIPIFLGLLYLLNILAIEQDGRAFWRTIAGITVLLVVGVGTKLTFGSQICASIAAIWVLQRTNLVTKRRAITACMVILLGTGVPLIAGRLLTKGSYNLLLGTMPGSEMTLRDILFFRAHDLHLLRAPVYDEHSAKPAPKVGVIAAHDLELLIKDKYSYPGLLEVAVFTDILNIYQYDPTDSYFGARSAANMRRMRIAVKTGLLFFFSILILTPIVIGKALWKTFVRKQPAAASATIIGLCSVAWYLNIVSGFLVVPAYISGYWIPRLVAPALIAFVVLAMIAIDEFTSTRSRKWTVTIFILVLFQSAVQLSFLWPWGVMKPY